MVDTLELLPSDWLNLEPLALDTPRPMRLIEYDRTTQRSALQYYSAVRAARSCLLTMLTSSSSFALIGHRTLELYYFILLLLFYFILFYFILFYFCETSQYLALFAATIFPISTPTHTLRRPVADLEVNVSDNIRHDVIIPIF